MINLGELTIGYEGKKCDIYRQNEQRSMNRANSSTSLKNM